MRSFLYFGITLENQKRNISIMRTFIYLFILFGFITCKSVHTEVSNHPFAINGASYNYWTGGRPGVSGIKVILNYTSDQKVTFDKIYFQKKEGSLEITKTKGVTLLIGNISTSKLTGPDLILDIDPKEEMNNSVPSIKIPFELRENEAVITYTYKGISSHYKVIGITQTASEFYP